MMEDAEGDFKIIDFGMSKDLSNENDLNTI